MTNNIDHTITTITDLYTYYPKEPLASAFLTTLDTYTLELLRSSVEETIKTFKFTDSFTLLPYQNYCVFVHKCIKKLLKQYKKDEKRNRASLFSTPHRPR